ncbi:hypothetical protein GS416_06265 [Rhodococcus hoagii]|nr:hypothetical protein [Prescottella equi]
MGQQRRGRMDRTPGAPGPAALLDDWVRAYEEVSGQAGLFLFTQMRADLRVHH